MKTETKPKPFPPAGIDARHKELKQMLISRHREVLQELHRDAAVEMREDWEFALMQLKAETAAKISDALMRLEEGRYGLCFECGDRIAESRLHALPFAARCKDCEEIVEVEQARDRVQARRASTVLGFEMYG